MDYPVEIALRGVPPSAELERYISEEARKLERICDRIRRCRVLAETLPGEKRGGGLCAVRLMVALPGSEIVVNRENGEDIFLAVRDAFAAAGVQLTDYMSRRAVDGKHGSG
jgi:hypothetical protein